MMLIFAFIGFAILPTVLGGLTLAAIEGTTPLLTRIERIFFGFLAGTVLLTYAAFMANVTIGVPFSALGFLGIWAVLTVIASIAVKLRGASIFAHHSALFTLHSSPRWAQILVGLFALSLAARMFLGGMVAATTPPYFDDTLNNWNIRGKLYYVTQQYTLLLPSQKPTEKPSALSAYPPMLPLSKAFAATLAGTWSDGLVDTIQLLWFIAVLGVVWSALRRVTNGTWALLGACGLGSLPLFLMQGVNAYSDIAMAAHIVATLALLFHALRSEDHAERLGLVRLSIFLAALLPFVKNEGLVLYLPAFLFFLAISAWHLLRHGKVTMKDIVQCIGFLACAGALLILPWLIYKWSHGMAFGNAKEISSLTIGWQQGVWLVVVINGFFEGNWNLLLPLMLILLAWQWRTAFRFPLLPLTAFFLLLWIQQILLFMFTSLSYEALFQTGYGRGMIQLMPVIVMVVTLLLVRTVDRERTTL